MEGEGMPLIDSHIHIDFYDNPDSIIQNIEKENLKAVFVTHLPELFEKYNGQLKLSDHLFLALGYHPILINQYPFDKNLFEKNLNHTRFIGEVGLDYAVAKSLNTRLKQRDVFGFICKIATNHIFSIHARQAEEDVLRILTENKVKKAIFHWYSGDENLIHPIIDAGYYFSLNPSMLKSTKGRNILKKIPTNRILIESDGPFVKYKGNIFFPNDLSSVYNDFSNYFNTNDLANVVYKNFLNILH